jgi:hypothetical protein
LARMARRPEGHKIGTVRSGKCVTMFFQQFMFL